MNDPLHGGAFNVIPWGQWDWPLTLSTPERAILEALDQLPNHESFDQIDKLMEGAELYRAEAKNEETK